MGSSVSAILAITFMNSLEKNILTTNNNIRIYRRYVDDICILTTDEENANQILLSMNAINPAIQFEIEHPNSNNSLSLLDFTLTICKQTGQHTFSFYQKSAKKNLFPHYKSALPTQTKRNIIQNETKRIKNRCSNDEIYHHHLNNFKDTLSINGYPDTIANSHLQPRPTRRQANKRTDIKGKCFYLNLPYFNDATNNKIKRIFQAANLNIRIYHKTFSLRQALKKSHKPICDINNCQIHSNICHTTYCIYSAECNLCKATYIGSTIRKLHIRWKEHISNNSSAIYKHNQSCTGTFAVSIAAKSNNTVDLRIKEGLLIRSMKPSLNSKEEEIFNLIG